MKKLLKIFLILLSFTSCSTLNESLLLGAGIGSVTVGVATTSAYDKSGKSLSQKEKLSNIGLGMIAGLITSYFVHDSVQEFRKDYYYQSPEIHFGDLPPSPFIMTPNEKRRSR